MDFPTIKKPKSNKHPAAATGGSTGGLFAKLEAMEQASAASPTSAKVTTTKSPTSAKVTTTKSPTSAKVPTANLGSDESDIIKGVESIDQKVQGMTKGDKSDKAEAIRIRALLMKSRAQGLGEKGAMAEEENPKRKKKK